MAIWIKSKSLTAQIREVERQIASRQRGMDARSDMLVKKLHNQLTDPITLLMMVGIGFLIGELTKTQPETPPESPKTTPITLAMNLITAVQTLYTILPLAWLMKFFQQPVSRY